MRRGLAVVGLVTGALLLAVVVALAFVYSGIYDVAASRSHSRLVDWVLETTMERSVAARAGELPGPLPTDEAALLHGLEHYRAMCVVCHGAPGTDRNELAEGLNPRPPRLQRVAARWTDAELFWITKHGIKATGMPGFGETHGDAELLQIVAIVRRLPDMSEAEYGALLARLDSAGVEPHDDAAAGAAGAAPHSHAPGAPAHDH